MFDTCADLLEEWTHRFLELITLNLRKPLLVLFQTWLIIMINFCLPFGGDQLVQRRIDIMQFRPSGEVFFNLPTVLMAPAIFQINADEFE